MSDSFETGEVCGTASAMLVSVPEWACPDNAYATLGREFCNPAVPLGFLEILIVFAMCVMLPVKLRKMCKFAPAFEDTCVDAQ